MGIKSDEGAFISEIFIDSPAYKGGLRPGDYIVELNGKKISNLNQIIRDVGNLEVGSTANFVVLRNGKNTTISVKITKREDNSKLTNSKLLPGFIALSLTDDIRKQLGITDKKVQGVVVSNVSDKSPASSLRLQNGDIITAVNGKSIKNLSDFYEELSKSSGALNFDVYSNGGVITTGTFKY